MINSKALTKQYQHLTEKERALLMIHADMSDDEQEFKRLKASAPVKGFNIRADMESNIANAWFWTHKDFISCKNFLYRKILDVNSLPLDDCFSHELIALDLAFYDVLSAHDLSINEKLLDGFSCSLPTEPIEPKKAEDIKMGEDYRAYTELFSNTCKPAL